MGGTALTVSGLNLIVPLALGVTLGLFLPATVVASGHTSRVVLALFIGVTMCVSAIPVIAKTLSDLNAHAMHPHLVKGAVALKAQMKQASQQVGSMRKIAGQYESNWMNTIKSALARKYPGFNDDKPARARTAAKKAAKNSRKASRP